MIFDSNQYQKAQEECAAWKNGWPSFNTNIRTWPRA